MEVQAFMTQPFMTQLTQVQLKQPASKERRRLIIRFVLAFILIIMSILSYIDYHEYVHSTICINEGGVPTRTTFISVNCTTSNSSLNYLNIYNELIASIMFPSIIIIFCIILIYIITTSNPNPSDSRKTISTWS